MSSAQQKKLTAHIKAQGCAAKIGPVELAQIVASLPQFNSDKLICGNKNFEDAAVYKLTDELALVYTTDFFPPLIDDPYLFGRIAAVNALSDVYAMGGKPLLALNIFCFPTCDYPLELAQAIIAGGASAIQEADCLLVGGHSIQAPEPIYGLSVIGTISPDKILSNDGGRAGDALVLGKALGAGIALLSHKGEQLSTTAYKTMIDSLSRLNGPCLEIASKYQLHAATDITGFGLIGHVHEMAQASGLAARIESKKLPLLPEVLQCAALGLVPAAAYANRKSYSEYCRIDPAVDLSITDIMFDPQTSGGILFSLPHDEASKLTEELRSAGWDAACIGRFHQGAVGMIEVI